MSNTARRQSITYPNGRVVNLGYGSTGSIDDLFSLVKCAAISGESGNKVEYTRAGLGRYVKIAYPQPGVEMSMIRPGGGSEGDSGDPYDGYDRFSRVQEMRWQGITSGTPIDAWQWGYNEASNRTWKKNLIAASGQDEAYGYDGLYQVIRDAVGTLNTNRTAVGGVPVEEEDFTYDPTGNWLGYRKEANGSLVLDQSRSSNQDNQLTQIDGSSALLSYDRAGNATKTPPSNGGDWSRGYQPVWDAWNRLVEVKESGTSVQKNTYDGLSRRITTEAATVGHITHTYWSDRWKPLEERIGSATAAARSYLWGERPGHRDELVLRDRDTDGNGSLDERLYATMDYFNGTAVLNTSGTVLERYAYSAFGVRRIMAPDFSPRSSSNYAWDFGFQGQFRDGETGWSNYGYRFYVPLLGRWINRDPIGERGGRNLYVFLKNSGVNQSDYLGLCNAFVANTGSFIYWLVGGFAADAKGNPPANVLPWSCFDPNGVGRSDADNLFRIKYRNQLLQICHEELTLNETKALSFSGDAIKKGAVSPEPWISLYDLTVTAKSVTAQKYCDPDLLVETCYIVVDVTYQASDTGDFNPGQSFGPGGVFKDDWFLTLQKYTPLGTDHKIYGWDYGQVEFKE